MTEKNKVCDHIKEISSLRKAKKYECEECIKMGSTWVHLRTCQSCGITLCCDSSPHKHASGHYHSTHHPVVISSEPGENWLWCFQDEIFQEYVD